MAKAQERIEALVAKSAPAQILSLVAFILNRSLELLRPERRQVIVPYLGWVKKQEADKTLTDESAVSVAEEFLREFTYSLLSDLQGAYRSIQIQLPMGTDPATVARAFDGMRSFSEIVGAWLHALEDVKAGEYRAAYEKVAPTIWSEAFDDKTFCAILDAWEEERKTA